jgi:hypothetical protein
MGNLPCRCIFNTVTEDFTSTPQYSTNLLSGDHDPPERPHSAEIWEAVNRVRHSRTMSGCHRLAQLLEFVVSSTLKGEAAHLKETTIGVFVFGRTPDYDPKADTIVRSQAWRLRAKLKKYYSSEGANDPVIIQVPIGHYVPAFQLRNNGAIGA